MLLKKLLSFASFLVEICITDCSNFPPYSSSTFTLPRLEAIRDAGIVKRTRGCRGGRSSARTYRIWPLEPALRVNTKKAYSNSVSTEADRRVHSTVTNGFINNIRIYRQPIKSAVNTSKPMSFAVLNTRSVRKKTLPVKDLVVEQDVDIFAITETWLSSESDEFIIRDLCLTMNFITF